MDVFFNPRSVAVAGASDKPNLGNHVVKNLKAGFKGDIYPINPNYETIEGLPCFPSIDAVPGHVDLVVVLIPAGAIPALLESCALKGTRRVIIESAGFDESGEEGRLLQEKCNRIAQKAGIRLWGPNCMGLVDVPNQRFFSFVHPNVRAEGVLAGEISLIVQSGMMSAIFLVELARRGVGIAKACSIGNRTDINECDILEYLENDPETKVIALYLESFLDGRRFVNLVRQSKKPIVLLQGGQSKAGAVAAMSHTSSLSGNSRLSTSVLSNLGVVMADSVFQMANMANTLVNIQEMDPACRIAIMTFSGGAGILACDALERNGLPIADFTEETRSKLKEIFPPWMPPANPVDLFPAVAMRGRMVAFMGSLKALMEDDSLDVLVIHVVVGIEATTIPMDELRKMADKCNKTIVFWVMGVKEGKEQFEQDARNTGFSVYSDVSEIAVCLKAVSHFNAHQKRKFSEFADDILVDKKTGSQPPLPEFMGVLDEFDSKNILRQWDIPVVSEQIVEDTQKAWAFASKESLPVVLKGLAPEMAHKTEHGLVKLGISDKGSLEKAFSDLKQRIGNDGRILVQKHIKYDYELIAGFLRDPQFGPCVMFGLGGILAELEPDVGFALAPLNAEDALILIRSLRNHKLLSGFRGMTPLEEKSAAQLLIDLGNLGTSYSDIEQIDINPLVVCKGLPVAVDANIVMKN